MTETAQPLRQQILEALKQQPALKAQELANILGCDRRDINRCLSNDLTGLVHQGSDYRWRLTQAEASRPASSPTPASEFARLCRYYLECISQDLDEGTSAFARNRYGDPDYAQLPFVPIGSEVEWWNAPGVGKLLAKVRADRGKLTAWLGYPVCLRQQRTARWEGFFVEPVLLWPVLLPEGEGEPPSIDEQAPVLNARFLRSVAMGGGKQLATEAAQLSSELGLGVPAAELPEIDDLIERLVRIRPDWGWTEPLDPSACRTVPSLAASSAPGIYNSAVVIPGERSPYTRGLETELRILADVPAHQLTSSVLGSWMAAAIPTAAAGSSASDPLIEALPMNTEQRDAVRTALTASHTVVTGPPGTGKSQVVTNMLVNAAWRGMKVLFASKNNKAVDVVEARVNGLGNRPVLLRLGAKEYQGRMAAHLAQVIASNPGPDAERQYEEALERHRSLATQLAALDRAQQDTLDRRNAVDRLETETEEARQLFGAQFTTLTTETIAPADADLERLNRAVDGVDRNRHGIVARLAWRLLYPRREKTLASAVQQATGTFGALGVRWQPWRGPEGVVPLRAQVHEIGRRVELARKAVRYREALRALQASLSFEEIAKRRADLTAEVGQNSERLWQEWVQLMPTRLTAAHRKDIADYAAAVQLLTGADSGRMHPSVKEKARKLQSSVRSLFSCCAITSLSARGRIPLEPGYFDLVIIDEASQCDIASALPLLYRAKRSVIIGDPMQLRHISGLSRPRDSELQHQHGLVEGRLGWMYSVNSLFDLAASLAPPANIINLRDHHRSHGDIIGFSNQAFYEGRLRVATRYQRLKRPNLKEPGIVWQDVAGGATRPRQGGAQNEEEARAVIAALIDLLVTRGYTGTVGVVTPFRAQAQLLRSLMQSREDLASVAGKAGLLVDTVHSFQGDERDVMFFSPVVSAGISDGALGFLRSNGNLFNVAITRARGLLHVVGDRRMAARCGVDYLEDFVGYVSRLDQARGHPEGHALPALGPDYPVVKHPERVSEWEHQLYRAMFAAGLRPIPQVRVEQYDLDFALYAGDRKLAIEVDGERYHRSWTGELCLRDQLRNQRLIELGWDVRRFWVYEVRDELPRCVQQVQAWTEGKGVQH
jgi:very-short-patch-repair endonuclease